MISIPFTKAHGAKNDFLLTWRKSVSWDQDFPALARAICDRYTGVGADGWMLVDQQPEPAIELWNSDGSKPEMSGNGTRCAAAFLRESGWLDDVISIRTGAGVKTLRVLPSQGSEHWFAMDMGTPVFEADHLLLSLASGERAVTVLNVGNPQCAVVVEDFEFPWRSVGAEIECHSHFPNRTNVSFLRPVDRHTIEVRFFERGAGETNSSGTGATGAAATAIRLGIAESPVQVMTPAGPLELRWEQQTLSLTGPAQVVAEGTFRYEKMS